MTGETEGEECEGREGAAAFCETEECELEVAKPTRAEEDVEEDEVDAEDRA